MVLLLGVVLGLFWGLAGYVLRTRTKLSVVEVSAWLAVAGLVLPRVSSDGRSFALACTAVSYVIMSSKERINKLWETLVVSGICALVVLLGKSVLVGIGGRLGTFAAISVLFFFDDQDTSEMEGSM